MIRQELYKLSDAARMIGVTTTTLNRWHDDGKIELVKSPSGRKMMQRSQIEKITRERIQ